MSEPAASAASAPRHTPTSRRGRKSVTRIWSGLSLRAQLVTGLAAVLAVAFVIIGLATTMGLRSWLITGIDSQLDSARDSLEQRPDPGGELRRRGDPIAALSSSGAVVVLIGPESARVLAGPGSDESIDARDVTAMQTVPSGPATAPVTVELPGLGEYRAVAMPAAGGSVLVAAVPLATVRTAVTSLAVVEVVVLGLTLVGLAVLGWWLIGLSLRPLGRVAEAASAVASLPLGQGAVAIPGRVLVADDRTEVGQVGSAVNAMLDHVEASLRVRSATEDKLRSFVSDAGHELRTPLAAVRGYSELIRLSADEHPEQTLDSAGRIELAAKRMALLVDDLLLLAAIDEGRPMAQELVAVPDVVSEAVAEAYAVDPEVDWDVSMPADPVRVLGDAARLHQAVVNLASNAIAHAATPGVVRITVLRDGDWVKIIVHDNGTGFAPELLTTATQRFTRGDASRSRATGGAGLGLAIARAIVEAHRGHLALGNDHGAWVCLYLPVPAPPDSPAPLSEGPLDEDRSATAV